jgi:hypothetical protein
MIEVTNGLLGVVGVWLWRVASMVSDLIMSRHLSADCVLFVIVGLEMWEKQLFIRVSDRNCFSVSISLIGSV